MLSSESPPATASLFSASTSTRLVSLFLASAFCCRLSLSRMFLWTTLRSLLMSSLVLAGFSLISFSSDFAFALGFSLGCSGWVSSRKKIIKYLSF